MEKLQVKLAEGKVLEIDPITKADTEQFFENFKEHYTEEGLKHRKERMASDDNLREILTHQHYELGRRLWLEVDVEDVYASQGLLSWLYSHSKAVPEKPGLRLMGCRLNSIMFEKPSNFTAEERESIIKLYNKVIGEQQK